MKKTDLDYIRSLIPANVPDGKKLVEEGREMGKSIPFGRPRFLEERGYATYRDYREDLIKQGKMNWEMLLGLSTLEEELEGIKAVHEFNQRTGLDISTMMHVPCQNVAIPAEKREHAPNSTAYMIETDEDYIAHNQVAPIQSIFEDHTLVVPNSLATTIGAIRSGSARVGIFAQFIWDFYGCDDDLERYSDVMRSIGIVASKSDEHKITVDSHLDDGIGAYLSDHVSYVGYALLENYIVNDLCGCPLSIAYGGMLQDGKQRMAIGMAIDKLLSKDGRRALSYIQHSTVTQWDHDIAANYGPSLQEALLHILVERKYKMGWLLNPVSVTERIAVPVLQDLLDIMSAGCRLEEFVEDWEDLMDFTILENMRDEFAEKGTQWFQNALKYFEEAGVDINNPLEMTMVIKKFNYTRLEEMFHPTTVETGTFTPYYPTVMFRRTAKMRDEIIDNLKKEGLEGSLSGKKIVVASGDCHTYALLLIEGVLEAMGANAVNGGVDITQPSVLLDLADEESTNIVAITVHNAQALAYARQTVELMEKRDKKYHIFMGGRLDTILPGDTVISDVTDMINDLGIVASNDIVEQVSKMAAIN